MNYQAVLRDNAGTIIPNTSVTMTFNIIEGTVGGSAVYSEQAIITTNGFGLVNHVIGTGGTSDDFSAINWDQNTYFLQVLVNLGSGDVDLGTTQLVSVPYSLHSKKASFADTAAVAFSAFRTTMPILQMNFKRFLLQDLTFPSRMGIS